MGLLITVAVSKLLTERRRRGVVLSRGSFPPSQPPDREVNKEFNFNFLVYFEYVHIRQLMAL